MFPLKKKNTTEVDARRVGSAGNTANMPGHTVIIDPATAAALGGAMPGASSGSASPPGSTQVFVISPGGSQSPPPTPQQPTEVHHHHHTVQVVSRRRGPAYNTSFFGSAGVVLGLLAALAAYESYGTFARPLALAGFVAGGIGFLGAIVFRRTRTGLPILALLLSAAGYVGWMYDNGQLQSQLDDLHARYPQVPKVDLPAPPVPAKAVMAGPTTKK